MMLSDRLLTATLVAATILLTACQGPSSPTSSDSTTSQADQSDVPPDRSGDEASTQGSDRDAPVLPGSVVVDGVTIFIGDHETGGAAPDALVMGTVTVVENCLVVVESDGADGSVPVFPQGTVVENGPDGPVVRTPVGELTVGDAVGLGGGFIGGLDDPGACDVVVPPGAFAVFSVQ